MPVLNTPRGKLRIPDGAPPEQVAQALQVAGIDPAQIDAIVASMPPAASPGVAPAPAAPGPAPAAPPSPAGPPAPAPVAASPLGAAPGPAQAGPKTPEQRAAELAEIRRKTRQEMINGMSGYERAAAGAGQAVSSNIRGIRQLWNMATGDDEELAQLNEQEREARIQDADLLNTGAGRSGQVAGHILQALLPAGAVAKTAKALQLGLRGTIAAEAGLGATLGAAQPTLEGESHKTNATVGGVLGGLIPGAGAAISSVRQYPQTILANALRVAMPRGTGGMVDLAVRATKQGSEAVRKEAGKQIGRLTEQVKVPLSKELASKLRAVRQEYGNSLPKDVVLMLDRWGKLAANNGTIKGQAVQEARSAIAREAAESTGVSASGLQRLTRLLDQSLEGQMTKAQIKALKAARDQYRSGIRPPRGEVGPAKRAAVRGTVQAVRSGSMPSYQQEN